ncbi:DUF3000 domain-containing protein [soil metagenome]
MGAGRELDQPPAQFRAAVEQLRAVRLRPEIQLSEVPAPQRIAPFAAALGADIVVDARDVGTGRLVLLHDPGGNDGWEGTYRCVSFVRAEVDPEMVRDPMLSAVAWSWLSDAWQAHGLEVVAPSGTVTVVLSEGFGNIARDSLTAQVEVRASWTPAIVEHGHRPAPSLVDHVEAWGELLGAAAGLEPLPSGVVTLPRRHGARG